MMTRVRTVVTTTSDKVYYSAFTQVGCAEMIEYKSRLKKAMSCADFTVDLEDGSWVCFNPDRVESIKIEVSQ